MAGDSYRPAPQRPLADRVTFGSGNQQGRNDFNFRSGRQGPEFPPPQQQNEDSSHPAKKRRTRQKKGRGGKKESADSRSTESRSAESRRTPPPANESDVNTRAGPRRTRNDTYRPNGDDAYSGAGGREQNGRGRGRGMSRPFRGNQSKHDRSILTHRYDEPERTFGVTEGVNKFLSLDELPESDAEMDIDSDDQPDASDKSVSGRERDHKVAKVVASKAADGDSVPKWSNPDPYTALPAPPPRETKFDPIALIRKAKNEQAAPLAKPAATDDDFISFDKEDDTLRPPPNAPSGPRNRGASAYNQDYATGSLNEVVGTGGKQPIPSNGLPARPPVGSGLPPPPPPPPPPMASQGTRGNKRKRDELDGGIIEEWLPNAYTTSTPWLRNGKLIVPGSVAKMECSDFEKMSMLFHNEIMDFYDYVKPHKQDIGVRNWLFDRIAQTLGTRGVFADTRVAGKLHCFGSFPQGLYLPAADLDLVYVSDEHLANDNVRRFHPDDRRDTKILWTLKNKLSRTGLATEAFAITKARVPLLKFTHPDTSIHCDLSFENKSGLRTQETLTKWGKRYEGVFREVIALVKQFLIMRGLNDVHSGGLGGFSIICLVYAYLHLAKERFPYNIGSVFLGFLRFYGKEFKLPRSRLQMSPEPKIVPKGKIGIDGRQEKADGLSIQDPNIPENNISGGSAKAHIAFKAFGEAYDALQQRLQRLDLSGNSILEAILGGDYRVYQTYKETVDRMASSADSVLSVAALDTKLGHSNQAP